VLRVEIAVLEKDISRNAGDVLLHEGIPLHQKVDAVGGENVLQLQTVDPGRVGAFHVVVVVVVVVAVDDANAEGLGVAEVAVLHAADVEVIGKPRIIRCLEPRVDLGEFLREDVPLPLGVDHPVPEGVLSGGRLHRKPLLVVPRYSSNIRETGKLGFFSSMCT